MPNPPVPRVTRKPKPANFTTQTEHNMPAIAQKQLDYLMIFIKMFADSADISEKQAFNYLDRHKGIEFVRDHYDVIHTLDFDYAIEDIRKVCRANGGRI